MHSAPPGESPPIDKCKVKDAALGISKFPTQAAMAMADRESETAGLEETAARADKGSAQVPRMAGMSALVELAGLFVPVDLADPALVELADAALVELADPALVELAEPSVVVELSGLFVPVDLG